VNHQFAEKRRLNHPRSCASLENKDRKTILDETLTILEAILDKSPLTADEIVMVLDCLKVRYAS
jgi:hypothetical protein